MRLAATVGGLATVAVLGAGLVGVATLSPGAHVGMSAPAAHAAPPRLGDDASVQYLRSVTAALQSAESLHLQADATVTLLGAEPCGAAASGAVAWGRYECWALGERYRIDWIVDPASFPGMQVSVAFNGDQFALLLPKGVLSAGDADRDPLLPALPNPLFELLQFLVPLSDANQAGVPRWRDLCRASFPAIIESRQVCENGTALARVAVPGAVYEGRAYVYHVYIEDAPERRVVRIERASSNGPLPSTEFSEHAPVGGWLLPRHARLVGNAADGSAGAEIEMSVTHVALSGSFDVETFRIPPASAVRIWDDTRGAFVPEDRGRD
jgi:hypothetical protein